MRAIWVVLSCFLLAPPAGAEKLIANIYIDADYSNHEASAQAIEYGVRTALDEAKEQLTDFNIQIVPLDHHGNVVKSKQNFKKMLKDPNGLFVMAGMHTPPLIKNRVYINQNEILTLVPWAAGGPITRDAENDNWIYRLSVDDTKAGAVLADFAVQTKGCRNPALFLESTPWGDVNKTNISAALAQSDIIDPIIKRFNWNVGVNTVRELLRSAISNLQADCIILVANTIEGANIALAMHNLNLRVPIISHWGITGGKFPTLVPAATREALDLSFIQTCFAFTNSNLSDYQQSVFKRLQNAVAPHIESYEQLAAPAGFIHAFDLTKLVIAALQTVNLTDDMTQNRKQLRAALENLEGPIQGLLKSYQAPFSTYDAVVAPDAHEALGTHDLCMAKYAADNSIRLIRN